jgi:hypothetical protein
MAPEEDSSNQHRLVGTALMLFSSVGIVLGVVMTTFKVNDGFIDGPSALGIGLLTLAVGFSLWRTGRSRG